MRVLFLMIAYPDAAKDTNMYTDLTCEFSTRGHEVYVAAPDHNATRINYEKGILVLRIKTLPLYKTSLIKKGFANILLPYQYKRAINHYFKNTRFDLVITPTPPITFINTVKHLKKKCGSKIFLILRDIFPQNAKDLGMIKNPLIFTYFRKKEKSLYRISDAIGCMSPGNIDFILSHNPEIDRKKLHLLPNWVKVVSEPGANYSVKTKFGLEGKFVSVFGGNFGIPQKLDFLIDVAERLIQNKEFVFLLVGDGTEKKRIMKLARDKKLFNVIFINQLPRKEYNELLRACDVGLVTLSDKFTIPNIPSRTLAYWSFKLPVIAAVDKHTDLGIIVNECNGGLYSLIGDVDAFISNLKILHKNPEMRIQMRLNGYDYLVRELNVGKAYYSIVSAID